MAFNWAGAAGGASDALGEVIKRQLLQQEMAQREQALAAQVEDRKLQREIQQQNAESLRMTREAQVDERKQRTEAKQREEQQRQNRLSWAQGVLSKYTQPAEGGPAYQPQSWQEVVEFERAKNIVNTGEDWPASLQSQVIASYAKNPEDRILSPAELAQRKELIDYQNRSDARFGTRGRNEPTQAEIRREHMTAVNNYIGWLLQNAGGDVEKALARFDANPQDAIRKAGGYMTLDDIRKVLEHSKGRPMTEQEKAKAAARAAAAKAAAQQAGKGE